ncbi:Exosome complex component mtr3 [Schizosaccharomyces pombe]
MSDRKRVYGPSVSVPPFFEEPEQPVFTRTRDVDRCRKIYLKLGWATKAVGSSYFESEKIKIACTVSGPRPSKTFTFRSSAKLNCEFRLSPFSTSVRQGHVQTVEEKSYSQMIEAAISPSILLHLYPKSSIDVYIQVIESDGALATLAAAISCASSAIADANIDCIDLVTGSSVLFNPNTDEYWIDPDYVDERARAAKGSVVMGYMASLGHVTQVWERGTCSPSRLSFLTEKCIKNAKDTRLVINHALLLEKSKSEDS